MSIKKSSFVSFFILTVLSVEIQGGNNNKNWRPQDAAEMLLLELIPLTQLHSETRINFIYVRQRFDLIPKADQDAIAQLHQEVINIVNQINPARNTRGLLTPAQIIAHQNVLRRPIINLQICLENVISRYLRIRDPYVQPQAAQTESAQIQQLAQVSRGRQGVQGGSVGQGSQRGQGNRRINI